MTTPRGYLALLLAALLPVPLVMAANAATVGPGAADDLRFLDEVSTWHSEVNLHDDHTKFGGRYIDGLVVGNGAMLVVEGMTAEITRFEKSRVSDSRLHGVAQFRQNTNGFHTHLSRSPKVPLHALAWVAGPVYTEYPTAFGFTFGGEYSRGRTERVVSPENWNHEAQFRIRRTNIVKNIVESEELRVVAVDFMPPELPAFLRLISVANTGPEPLERCRFTVGFRVDPRNWTGSFSVTPKRTDGPVAAPARDGNELDFYSRRVLLEPQIAGEVLRRSVLIDVPADAGATNGRLMLIGTPDDFAKVGKQFLEFDLDRLAPGEVRTLSVQIVTGFDAAGLATTRAKLAAATPAQWLRETYAHWTARLAAADLLAMPLRPGLEPRVVDYIDGLRTFLLSLHTRDGGAIAHPYSYNAVFLRDGYDVFRAMLALGHREECRRTILFFKEAMHRFGIAMSYSPRAFATARENVPSRIGEIHEVGHFVKSEYMLFFPMMVRDYVGRFGDDELARALYPEMQRALASQPIEGEGLIAYSGDEISVKRGARLYRYSAQNAALYVQAAGFTANVAQALGRADEAAGFTAQAQKVRASLERRFWNDASFYVYSVDGTSQADARVNVFCQALPYFYGYLTPDNARLPAMVASVKCENMFPSHRVATLPIAGRRSAETNGNSIGLLLYLMALARDPEAAAVFDRMIGDAGTMGTAGEYLVVTNDSITRGEALRPYESSFNLCAALEYLRADTGN